MTEQTKLEWVKDCEKVRSFDSKRVEWKDKGIFTMHVSENGPNGETNPGHVLLNLEPWDLTAGMNIGKF